MTTSNPETVTYNSNPEWESRQDVVYHYLAYHFFDAEETTGATTIELVNLTDADKDYFNRVALITRGLSTEARLVSYLTTPPSYVLNRHFPSEYLDSASTNTYRRRFIHHVRAYNLTQPDARARFYIIGLTEDDIEYLTGLEPVDASVESTLQLSLASDGCLRGHEVLAADVQVVDRVGARIVKFTEKIHQTGRNGNSAALANCTCTNQNKSSDDNAGETEKPINHKDIETIDKVGTVA